MIHESRSFCQEMLRTKSPFPKIGNGLFDERRGWDSNPRGPKTLRALQARALGQTMRPLQNNGNYMDKFVPCQIARAPLAGAQNAALGLKSRCYFCRVRRCGLTTATRGQLHKGYGVSIAQINNFPSALRAPRRPTRKKRITKYQARRLPGSRRRGRDLNPRGREPHAFSRRAHSARLCDLSRGKNCSTKNDREQTISIPLTVTARPGKRPSAGMETQSFTQSDTKKTPLLPYK